MRHPPPLSHWFGYPITVGVAALAVVATVGWQNGADIQRLMMSSELCWQQPWRLLTPTLFHVNLIHLIFNLYWLWVFGTLVEDQFGHAATLGIFALFAAGSEGAEYGLLHPGVGLSGVNYGLFGLLWVLSRYDPRFRDAVDRQTVQLLVGWFFLCIVLTVADVWNVGNIAHGAGFCLGALLGWTLAARGVARRVRNAATLAAAMLLCLAAGTVARPYVNLSGQELAYSGYQALDVGNPGRAVTLYRRAVAIDPNQHDWWFNLGVAYQRLGRFAESNDAFRRAAALKPPS